jgi:L-lactate dehydrogenase complex protein LldF
MQMKNLKLFLKRAEKNVFDEGHRKRINYTIAKYNEAVPKAKLQFDNYELARDRAAFIKNKVVQNLEKYLLEFELNFAKHGGELLWAQDAAEANQLVLQILKKHECRTVVKSKSMVTEEIQLNDSLEKNGLKVYETDLGEFIVQLEGEPPYHIVTPAMHKSKEDVANLFHEKLGSPLDFTPEQLTSEARKVLRDKFINADAGITGANFLVADIGAVSITENEGNARLCTSLPPIHIAITGIEKLIPSLNDLSIFLPLLATLGTGQNLTTYNTLFFGPKKNQEIDGPEKMYLILLDNGRTNLLKFEQQSKALACIRCGACLNVCPVFKNIGGHTYNSVYNGPIGAIITPFLYDFEENIHLSYATSLCYACTEVCPVKIDLAGLLLSNKHYFTENFKTSRSERRIIGYFTRTVLKRKNMNFGSSSLKTRIFKIFLKKTWNRHKEPIQFADKNFNQLWKERQSNKNRI